MDVVWLTAFLDLPSAVHDAGVAFWRSVTQTDLSPPRGAQRQFATLLPRQGDAMLRSQRLGDHPRIHVDLHVPDVEAAAAAARRIGARELIRSGHIVLASPGGLVFCLVRDRGERLRPPAVTGPTGGVTLVDEVCLDAPIALAEAEIGFWAALTGWRVGEPEGTPERTRLDVPTRLPLGLLVQRLGIDDPQTVVSAHLDLACGSTRDVVVAEHRRLGAEALRFEPGWTVMRDPAGLVYCLTDREPVEGAPPA